MCYLHWTSWLWIPAKLPPSAMHLSPRVLPLEAVVRVVAADPVAAIQVLEVAVVAAADGWIGRGAGDRSDGILGALADERRRDTTGLIVPHILVCKTEDKINDLWELGLKFIKKPYARNYSIHEDLILLSRKVQAKQLPH